MSGEGDAFEAETIADSLLEPVFAVDDGVIRFANQRFCEVFDIELAAVLGTDLAGFEAYVEGGAAALKEAVAAVAAGDAEERRVELEMRHPETAPVPERLPAEARITPLELGTSADAVVVSLRNIAERRERERELERQRSRLEKFASVVAHDLRNPLNVAIGSLELAGTDHDSEQLARASRALDRMAELIDELLALGRVGGIMLDLEPVVLDELVAACWTTVETGDASLSIEMSARIRAHPSRLRQLLENLFRNAVEHGGPSVNVTVGGIEDGFYVEDDGPGIEAHRRTEVLIPGTSSAEAGSGIGLAIVSAVAEAHGWSVEVTDGRSGGARFEFRGVEAID